MSFSTFISRLAVLGLGLGLMAGCATAPDATPQKTVISIDQTERGVLMPLPNTVLFEFGKSELNRAAADPYLEKIALLIKNKSYKQVAVEGHTDNVGTLSANQLISDARARVVLKALQSYGVPAERMKAEGFAYQRPVVSNINEDGRTLNRRVEIIILEEKVEVITAGEPANAFESAFNKLKALIDQGLVKSL